jgi:hypothetical protein
MLGEPQKSASVLEGKVFADAADEAIRLIPDVLWFLFAVIVLAIFYRPIRDDLIPRLSSLKLPFGLELTLRERVAEAARKQKVTVSEDDKDRIVRRLERSAHLLKGARDPVGRRSAREQHRGGLSPINVRGSDRSDDD